MRNALVQNDSFSDESRQQRMLLWLNYLQKEIIKNSIDMWPIFIKFPCLWSEGDLLNNNTQGHYLQCKAYDSNEHITTIVVSYF